MYHTTIIDYYYTILKYHKAITNEMLSCFLIRFRKEFETIKG